MGKSTINDHVPVRKLLVYQRVKIPKSHSNPMTYPHLLMLKHHFLHPGPNGPKPSTPRHPGHGRPAPATNPSAPSRWPRRPTRLRPGPLGAASDGARWCQVPGATGVENAWGIGLYGEKPWNIGLSMCIYIYIWDYTGDHISFIGYPLVN